MPSHLPSRARARVAPQPPALRARRAQTQALHGFLYRDLVHRTLRPFLRRALMTARPDGVAMRARKPDVRVARRRVPRLVHPIDVLELATTVSGMRGAVIPGRRVGARDMPVSFSKM